MVHSTLEKWKLYVRRSKDGQPDDFEQITSPSFTWASIDPNFSSDLA